MTTAARHCCPTTEPAPHTNACRAIAAIREVQARTPDRDDRSHENDRCDGPDERIDADVDADRVDADKWERANERAFWGGAA